MAEMAYFGKTGKLRLYSGSSDGTGGVYYFEVAFEQMDFTVVGGRPRPDEIPVLDRGVLNTYTHHVPGPDSPLVQPQNLTFTAMIDNTRNRNFLPNAMGNLTRLPTWSVNGVTWSNVNGTTSLMNGFGSSVSTPLPYDTQHDRVHVLTLWQGDPQNTGLLDFGFACRETWFQPAQVRITEAADSVKLAATGWIYGPISMISVFDAGTAV